MVTPTRMTSTESLRKISLEKRKCRFLDETEGVVDMFKYYTQAACKFECAVKRAIEICQ